jgi:hypothetical protein
MIVQGRHGRARTPEHGAMIQAQIPECRLVALEQAGHTP